MITNSLNRAVSSFYWNVRGVDRTIRRYWRDLDAFGGYSPIDAKHSLVRRLQDQIAHFAAREDALPEWREASKLSDPEEFWTAWQSLPIITKQDLRTRFHPDELKRRFKLQGAASSTGGSTGEPTPYFHDEPMRSAKYATQLYCQLQFGWKPGMPIVQIWGSERDIGKHGRGLKAGLAARIRNQWLVDGYQLTARTTSRVLAMIERLSPVAVYGFTGLLEFVSRQVLESGSTPTAGLVRTAWNGGEMLYENQVDLFQRAFGAPLLNLYGGRELSAMAYQPRLGAPLRVLRPLLFVEIVDDRGIPVPPGETGRLIWTSTVCRGTPFLRYDIGDVGSADVEHQDESGVHALAALQGRRAGLLTLPSGRTIGCIFWNHLFKEYPEIEQFQVALIGDQRVDLRFRGPGLDHEREYRLLNVVRGVLDMTDVNALWVDRIPLTPQGKLVQVVREQQEVQ